MASSPAPGLRKSVEAGTTVCSMPIPGSSSKPLKKDFPPTVLRDAQKTDDEIKPVEKNPPES